MYSPCSRLSSPTLWCSSPISSEVSSLASLSGRCITKQPSGLIINSQKLRANSKATSLSSTIAHGKAYRSSVSAILTDDNSTAVNMEEDAEDIGLFSLDPGLEAYKDHFKYRIKRYVDQKKLIEKHEGSLEDFAQGYRKFGFNREEGCIAYHEWAPAAQEAEVIGDFNGWNGAGHKMEKNQFGVWSIRIPDIGGNPAIPHNSRVKFRFKHSDGVWVDRIPAWIKYATQDCTRFAAPYDGVYWDPPPAERYQFKHPRPTKPEAPRIYEAHVGMSSSEPHEQPIWYSEDLKYLIDKAHSLGLRVLMDVVHSHASNNITDGLNGFDVGQSSQDSYFHTGDRGYHKLWDSRLFNYANWEVLRFLLSNLRWWLDEFKFDGFRFDGVTSMLYHHHGINIGFTGNYSEYFSEATDVDAVVYLMLANNLIHSILPDATVVAEDVSGMPGLGRTVSEGGIGFEYRLAMAIPDKWIDYLKNKNDEEWSMSEITGSLTNRRYTEKCIAYAESHDQSIVGDKTIAFFLMDKEMYSGMSCLTEASPIIERGMALHKMIHFLTMALGGEGYLNFMGNEFLNAFDRAMNSLDEKFKFLASTKQIVSSMDEVDKVIVFERGDLVFVFNFHPENTYDGYKVGCDLPGKYRVALDSDAWEFGGPGRVGHDVDHFTTPEGIPGVPETNFNNRPNSFKVLSPPRTCVVYYRVEEEIEESKNDESTSFDEAGTAKQVSNKNSSHEESYPDKDNDVVVEKLAPEMGALEDDAVQKLAPEMVAFEDDQPED